MVTVAEALRETEQAEEQAVQREEEIQKAESQFQSLKQTGELKEQFALAQSVGFGGVGETLTRRRRAVRKEKQRGAKVIGEAREELSQFRTRISKRKGEIERVRGEIAQRKKLLSDITLAQKLAEKGVSAEGRSKRVKKLTRQARERRKFEDLRFEFVKSRAKGQEISPLTLSLEEGVPLSLPDVPRQETIQFTGKVEKRFQVDQQIFPSSADLARLVTDVSERTREGDIFLPVTPKEFSRGDVSTVSIPKQAPEFAPFGVPSFSSIKTPKLEFLDLASAPSKPLKGGADVQDVQEQDLLPPSPTGEFGGRAVTPEGTTFFGSVSPADTSLGAFIKRREPLKGTLGFLVERGRGIFGKLEERFTPQSQKLAGGVTGERVSFGVQTLPFIIPTTAPIALASTGISQFVTTGGRTEIEGFGRGVEERFGIPSEIGQVAGFGLAGAGVVIGGVGLVRQAERALGFPKFDVKFLAEQQPSQQLITTGEETFISTRGAAEITRRGLISERKAISGFESLARITPQDDIFTFQAATRGVSREFKGVQLPTEKLIFGKVRGFGGLTGGVGKETQQFITLKTGGITAKAPVEGFEFIGSTKLFTQRGKEFEKFITVGKGFDLPSGLVTKSQSAQIDRIVKLSGEEFTRLSKTGRTEAFGLTRRPQVDDIGAGQLILKTKRQDISKAISEQTTRQILSQTFPKTPTDIISRVSTRPLGAVTSFEQQFPSIVQQGGRARGRFTGTGQFELTSGGGLIDPVRGLQTGLSITDKGFQFPKFTDTQISKLGLGLSLIPRQLQRERFTLRELSGLAQPLAQQPRQKSLQLQAQKQLQLQRQRQKQQFRSPSFADFFAKPFFGGGGFGAILPLPKRGKRDKAKRTKVKRERRFPLAPSFTAQSLGITGKFPTPKIKGLGLLPTQLRVIPRRKKKRR